MQVALDEQIFAVQHHGGISRLFYELAKAFITDSRHGVHLMPLSAPIVNEYVLSDDLISSHLNVTRARTSTGALARYLGKMRGSSNPDVVHNTFYLPHGLRSSASSRRVITIYDMIPELFPNTKRRLDFLTRKRQYIHRADHIICISQSTHRDLLRIYPDIQAPITVAYPGVSSVFCPHATSTRSLPTPYILHVGNRSGYKDAHTLIEAFALIAPHFLEHSLLLAGGGPLSGREESVIRKSGIRGRVHQLTMREVDMPAAYAQADATVFPSRYEGFGLPALEAMASGSPLIMADSSSLPEIGGDVAQYFPPGNVEVLSRTLEMLLQDFAEQQDRSARGIDRARGFTWSGYAEATADAYKAVVAK